VPTKKQPKELSKKADVWEQARVVIRNHDVKAVPRLIKTLTGSRLTEERTVAAYALGFLQEKNAIAPLLTVLQNKSENERVRGQAAEALAYICQFRPDPRVHRALLKTLSDSSVEVRFWSTFALGALGKNDTVAALQDLARRDKSSLPGWWSISKEAKAAIRQIKKRNRELRTGHQRPGG
jgi:HEAT repeat protein